MSYAFAFGHHSTPACAAGEEDHQKDNNPDEVILYPFLSGDSYLHRGYDGLQGGGVVLELLSNVLDECVWVVCP